MQTQTSLTRNEHGGRWTPELDNELLRLISSGKTTSECATELGRTELAIEWRKLRHTKELINKGRFIEDACKLTQLSSSMIEVHFPKTEYDSDDYFESPIKCNEVVPDEKYKNSKIYELRFGDTVIYRGSTYQTLEDRLKSHRNSSGHGNLSAFIKKVGPKNINIRLVESYPCKTRGELLARERALIREESQNNDLLNIKHRYVQVEAFNEMLLTEVSDIEPTTNISCVMKKTPGGIYYTSEQVM
jgi:hypothetical protein